MMDLSDGLARDLPRLAKASGCGFEIELESIPRRAGCGIDAAVGDGEDYELLVAVEKAAWPGLSDAWKTRFPDVPLTAIGRLAPTGVRRPASIAGGWDHFSSQKGM
jgi:thiamine-monophosphate kinase